MTIAAHLVRRLAKFASSARLPAVPHDFLAGDGAREPAARNAVCIRCVVAVSGEEPVRLVGRNHARPSNIIAQRSAKLAAKSRSCVTVKIDTPSAFSFLRSRQALPLHRRPDPSSARRAGERLHSGSNSLQSAARCNSPPERSNGCRSSSPVSSSFSAHARASVSLPTSNKSDSTSSCVKSACGCCGAWQGGSFSGV